MDFDCYEPKYIKEETEKKEEKKEGKKKGIPFIFACFLFGIIIFIGVFLALLIISSINIASEFKIFYLLNIISIIIPIIAFIIMKYSVGDRRLFIRLTILIACKYIYDGVSYFFYFYEKIITLVPLILLIISEVVILPGIYMGCCFCFKNDYS